MSKNTTNNLNSYSQKISTLSKNLERYVRLDDNQYVLDIPNDQMNNITVYEVNEYTNYLNSMNNIIKENNIENVSLKNGFMLQVSDSKAMDVAKANGININEKEISTYAGISKFRWTTGGFDWWLTDFQAGLVIVGASTGAGVLIGLVPGLGWKLALSVANAVISFAASNSIRNGMKISYRAGKYLRIYPQ